MFEKDISKAFNDFLFEELLTEPRWLQWLAGTTTAQPKIGCVHSLQNLKYSYWTSAPAWTEWDPWGLKTSLVWQGMNSLKTSSGSSKHSKERNIHGCLPKKIMRHWLTIQLLYVKELNKILFPPWHSSKLYLKTCLFVQVWIIYHVFQYIAVSWYVGYPATCIRS